MFDGQLIRDALLRCNRQLCSGDSVVRKATTPEELNQVRLQDELDELVIDSLRIEHIRVEGWDFTKEYPRF